MNVQQKIDKVLEIVRERIQEEVGALMGVDFKLIDLFSQLCSKESYFAEQSGKKIVAKMDITGDIEGNGALVIGIKDAIRLGGTLIMLPQSELDEVVNSENYSEETEDSYGEIANIIAGSYTKVFEEMFPKSCRFIRKEQEIIAPLKVDIASEDPFPDQWYYAVKTSMSLDGVQMEDIEMLMPAEAFGMEIPEATEEKIEAEVQDAQNVPPQGSAVDDEPPVVHESEQSQNVQENSQATENTSGAESPETETRPAIKDIEKHRKFVDSLLTASNDILAQEVGALLGVDVKLSNYNFRPISKEEFFLDEASGKQVLTHMDIVDDVEGKSYLFVGVKDAIRLGSILIMLPPSELEAAVNEEDFSPDAEDAYGEIANIISGAYTNIFQDQYKESIRFIKKDLETVAPMKVDTESDDAIPNQHYYMSSGSLTIDGQECGILNMLIPISILQLDQLISEKQGIEEQAEPQSPDNISSISTESKTNKVETEKGTQSAGAQVPETYEILLIENDSQEASKIQGELDKMGIMAKTIGFNDNISYYLNSQLRLVVIVMKDIDEQAYGVTIKVNTHTSIPIVAAGAQWTRTKVIKAVKYGVNDILLTPANIEDIQEKIQSNMMQLAA